MLRVEEQSKSATNSVPLEGSSNSGTYFPSFIEKARNIKTDSKINTNPAA